MPPFLVQVECTECDKVTTGYAYTSMKRAQTHSDRYRHRLMVWRLVGDRKEFYCDITPVKPELRPIEPAW